MQVYRDSLEKQAELSLTAMEESFQVSIALHDLRGTVRHPDGRVFLVHRNIHRHECCRYQRYDRKGWDAYCYHDCFTSSEKKAVEIDGSFFKTCWKGVGELVVPLIHDNFHQLSFYAGVFRVPDAEVDPGCAADPVYRQMLEALPLPDEAKLRALSAQLTLFGHGLLYSLRQTNQAEDTTRGAAIRRFVAARAHLPLTIHDLAEHLHLSPSRASHAVSEYTGMTFQELLLHERMLRAKSLLFNSQGTLDEIAVALGYSNGFYFNRVFRKFYGLPPGEYKKQNRKPS